jgi:hypothetical protein
MRLRRSASRLVMGCVLVLMAGPFSLILAGCAAQTLTPSSGSFSAVSLWEAASVATTVPTSVSATDAAAVLLSLAKRDVTVDLYSLHGDYATSSDTSDGAAAIKGLRVESVVPAYSPMSPHSHTVSWAHMVPLREYAVLLSDGGNWCASFGLRDGLGAPTWDYMANGAWTSALDWVSTLSRLGSSTGDIIEVRYVPTNLYCDWLVARLADGRTFCSPVGLEDSPVSIDGHVLRNGSRYPLAYMTKSMVYNPGL